jgi:hypothetical protein
MVLRRSRPVSPTEESQRQADSLEPQPSHASAIPTFLGKLPRKLFVVIVLVGSVLAGGLFLTGFMLGFVLGRATGRDSNLSVGRTTAHDNTLSVGQATDRDNTTPSFTAAELYERYKRDPEETKRQFGGKVIRVQGRALATEATRLGFNEEVAIIFLAASKDMTHGDAEVIVMFRASASQPFAFNFLKYVQSLQDGQEVVVKGKFTTKLSQGKEGPVVEDASIAN